MVQLVCREQTYKYCFSWKKPQKESLRTNAYLASMQKAQEVQVFRGIDENPANNERGKVRT